ncbi:MAG: MerR family transcriptional regulator [Bacteroidales bacterium]|nr:MerR family transcriptional regulator [Bacteroidales bacterium]
MANYTIRDLEKLSGIKAHTIRMWEKRYSLIEPTRTSTNIRTYCDTELRKLLNISILNRNGIKISKIAQLTPEELSTKINQLSKKADDTETQIEHLAIAMIDIDENKFERILARMIMQLGFEETIIRIVYPFLERIGIMWQTGTINPAQEHFVSNLIRQKLISAIDSLNISEKPNHKNFLLYLPEGEMHELGLLFFSYLIKKRGHKVIYLGQSVPFENIIEVCRIRQANILITSFISSFNTNIDKYIEMLAEAFKNDKTIYISGSQIQNHTIKYPDNIIPINSPKYFIEELNKISSE